MKHVISILVLVAMVATLAFGGQSSAKRNAKAVVASDKETPAVTTSGASSGSGPRLIMKTSSFLEQKIGDCWYDYGWNSGGPRHTEWYVANDGVSRVYMIYISKYPPASGGTRGITYVSYDGSTFSTPQAVVPTATQATYFSGISVWRGGSADGLAGVGAGWAGSGHSYYGLEGAAGAGGFTLTLVSPFRDVQATNLDSNGTVVLNDSKSRTDYEYWFSTDFGSTWTLGDTDLVGSINLPGGQSSGSLEPPTIAQNGNLYMFSDFLAIASNQVPPFGTNTADSASQYYLCKSTDMGATWTGTKLWVDGIQYDPGGNPNLYSGASNFEQHDMAMDKTENYHIVFNAYPWIDLDPGVDTLWQESADAVYYDATHGFRSLVSFNRADTMIAYAENIRGVAGATSANRAGCSYPSIAVSDDGKYIVCTWSQKNWSPGVVDTTVSGFSTSNIWYNFSTDGGGTWAGAQKLTTATGVMEEFSNLADRLEISGGNITARATFIRIHTDGMGDATDAEDAIYVEWTMPVGAVNDGPKVALTYKLDQNYPNPFNPSSVINYSLATSGNVKLTVYNVLGQEVATLVNGFQPAGSHSVNFNAKNLASGVYLYTINAGSFSATKKMVLMK